ncbi:glycoside hydrolase family 43 protein [Runella salmonicolor]|uniref:Glycoside hydrolase family 43 protein n=1 Tax=Runella salmonicolor TaxID=2950278 RepID=A0ABT1FJK7_9BACT|nr:glycoside hydrolase family 43 protein [Runella salmonicolor]MCP1381936.1 glycoside hydrolase family 43 protein [Runella salmonicolor]
MKIRSLVFLMLFPFLAIAQKEAYLFSYFIKNGEDGLHFAYSTDGLTWQALKGGTSFLQPLIGKDKLMRDPCIYQDKNGTFHMVWTSGWWDKIVGYASSKDLVNWSEQKVISVMEHEPTAKNSWAPEIAYDKKTNLFLIFWATTIPGRHTDVADSEKEKGLNHRMYYVTTPDFKTFSETKMYFNPEFSVIDATIFEKGKEYYMFLKNENPKPAEKNIRITKANSALGPFPTQVSAPITGDYWAEGPTAIEVGEYVYVYFDKYTQHKYGAVRSKDMKTWEDVSDQVKFPEGIRHGTAFKVSPSLLESLKKL